jgi:putative sugar O-methyltransferase
LFIPSREERFSVDAGGPRQLHGRSVKVETPSDPDVLQQMLLESQRMPPIYQPSQFWLRLNAINVAQINRHGLHNFKRTVHQNYYNWIPPSLEDNQIGNLMAFWASHPSLVPLRTRMEECELLEIWTGTENPLCCEEGKETYRLFVGLLWWYTLRNDTYKFLSRLAEPEIGNPIRITLDGVLISQDIANSVRELTAICDVLDLRTFKPVILELGAGYGRLCYACMSLLSCRYLIVDVPPALYVAQWYLQKVFPDKRVFAFRPFDDFGCVEREIEEADICFFTPNQLELLPDSYVDVALSISSLGEMTVPQIDHYKRLLEEKSRKLVYLKQWINTFNEVDHVALTKQSYNLSSNWALALDRVDAIQDGFFEMAFTPPCGRPRGVTAQLLHRPSTAYAVIAAAAQGYIQNDLQLVERLISAYQHSAAEFEGFQDSMWRNFFNQHHQAAHRVFMEGRADLAAAILRDPGSSDLFYGFDNLTASTNKKVVLADEEDECMDHLIRLAEAIGAQRLDNPSAYMFRGDIPTALDTTSADTIVDRIEHALGCTLSFPNPFPLERGVLTSRGIVSYYAVPALYQAWRIKQLLKGVPRPRVLEIGAGLGRTAYYAWQLGIRDYTIIDIPMTSISQGYFLGRVLGENAVLLAGEAILLAGNDLPEFENRVRILPPSHFLATPNHYDLVLNANSFTEFGESVAQGYWKQIESKADIFLSMNHEANAYTVRQFIDSSPRIDTYDRHPCWIRKGYVEETVRFKRNNVSDPTWSVRE